MEGAAAAGGGGGGYRPRRAEGMELATLPGALLQRRGRQRLVLVRGFDGDVDAPGVSFPGTAATRRATGPRTRPARVDRRQLR